MTGRGHWLALVVLGAGLVPPGCNQVPEAEPLTEAEALVGRRAFQPEDRVRGNEPDPGVVVPRRARQFELPGLPARGSSRPRPGQRAVVITPDRSGTIVSDLPASGCTNPNGSGEAAAAWEATARLWKWLGFEGCPGNADSVGESASYAHAAFVSRYVMRNRACFPNNNNHLENRDCRGFSGRTFVDRWQAHSVPNPPVCAKLESEIIASSAEVHLSGPQGVQRLIDAPLHRLPFLRSEQNLPSWGWSEWCEWEGIIHWVCDYAVVGLHARWDEACNPPNTVSAPRRRTFYPMPGESKVPNSWDGNELPQPPPPPAGYPSGYPIQIQRPGFVVTGTALCRVESDGSCTHVPHNVVMKSSNWEHTWLLDEGEAFVYAHQPTLKNRVYRVQFFGFDLPEPSCSGCQGTPAAPWWEFRTRNDEF